MKYSTKNLKNLLIQCSELNLTIANILNSGGSMSESKETKTEVTAAEANVDGKVEAPSAEAGAAEASVVAEVVAEEAKVEETVASETPVVTEAVTETAEAALVSKETVVVERVSVSDGEAGVYATQQVTTETRVDQYVETEKEEGESEASKATDIVIVPVTVAAVASDPFAEKFTAEKATALGLSEAEASVSVGLSFVDLVKVVASLTQEVVQYREKAQAAELQRVTEARIDELKQLNVPLDLSEGSADYTRITGMEDVAFAAYRDGIRVASKAVASAPVVKNDKTVEKAKASLKDLAVTVPLTKESKKSKFTQI